MTAAPPTFLIVLASRDGRRASFESMGELLSEEEIAAQLGKCPGWEQKDNEIARTFEFATFLDGIDFVTEVAELAEEANHHPDIDIRWRKVFLRLSTHSAGGLTDRDFSLAQQVSDLIEG